jgi:hypothetical protein
MFALCSKLSENLELVSLKLSSWSWQGGEFVMRIAYCGGVARKMLTAGEDACGLQGAVEDTRHLNDLICGSAVAATAQGIIRLIVKGNVEYWAEVEIESEESQQFSGEFTMSGDEREIPPVTKLAGIRRLIAEKLQSGNAPPFLINRDDRLNLADCTELIGKVAKLGGGLDISSKKNESSGLYSSDEICIVIVNFDSRDAEEQELTDGSAFHSVRGNQKTSF